MLSHRLHAEPPAPAPAPIPVYPAELPPIWRSAIQQELQQLIPTVLLPVLVPSPFSSTQLHSSGDDENGNGASWKSNVNIFRKTNKKGLRKRLANQKKKKKKQFSTRNGKYQGRPN